MNTIHSHDVVDKSKRLLALRAVNEVERELTLAPSLYVRPQLAHFHSSTLFAKRIHRIAKYSLPEVTYKVYH